MSFLHNINSVRGRTLSWFPLRLVKTFGALTENWPNRWQKRWRWGRQKHHRHRDLRIIFICIHIMFMRWCQRRCWWRRLRHKWLSVGWSNCCRWAIWRSTHDVESSFDFVIFLSLQLNLLSFRTLVPILTFLRFASFGRYADDTHFGLIIHNVLVIHGLSSRVEIKVFIRILVLKLIIVLLRGRV